MRLSDRIRRAGSRAPQGHKEVQQGEASHTHTLMMTNQLLVGETSRGSRNLEERRILRALGMDRVFEM
jgi:hypothetical protein